MRLLIITQVVDSEHPILGFFHRWIQEFSEHCESIQVICLQEGKHSLPANVTVHSLCKEAFVAGLAAHTPKGPLKTIFTKLRYTLRFYKLIWRLRHEYDNVFVHMNQIYVILGGALWRSWGKKIGLWYAHGAVTNSLRLATLLSNLVFTSTVEGMRLETPKRQVVGQGIDTQHFCLAPQTPSYKLRLITVGRISPSKNIATLLRACAELKKQNIVFSFRIVGLATNSAEERYATEMRSLSASLGLTAEVEWVGAIAPANLPAALQDADVFIHDGATNSLDKALLEAVLCGCVVVSSNPAYHNLMQSLTPQYLYQPKDHLALAAIVDTIGTESALARLSSMQPVREFINHQFSVSSLVSGIVGKY